MSQTGTTTGAGESRVRVARERKGLTQVELAERVGCHVLTLKRWEHGTHKPGTPELAQQLANVLEQPLEWLFPPEEHPYVRDARARYPTTATEIPDPHDVLATLRPGRRARPSRLAAALALLATAAAIALAVAAPIGSRHSVAPSATTSSAQPLTLAVDAFNPAGVEPAATAQPDRTATTHATRVRTHARRSAKRARRRTAARRHRAHRRHRSRSRSRQPTYLASAATSPVSQAAAPTPAGAGTQPAVATNTTAASAATTTVQQPASSSANQPVAAAPDGPSEFDGP